MICRLKVLCNDMVSPLNNNTVDAADRFIIATWIAAFLHYLLAFADIIFSPPASVLECSAMREKLPLDQYEIIHAVDALQATIPQTHAQPTRYDNPIARRPRNLSTLLSYSDAHRYFLILRSIAQYRYGLESSLEEHLFNGVILSGVSLL